MATLKEISDFRKTPEFIELNDRVREAAYIKAVAISNDAGATAAQIAWAREYLTGTGRGGAAILNFVLASNSGATVAQIIAAPDSAVQNNVNNSVDNLLGA